jgi:hypothetical protein
MAYTKVHPFEWQAIFSNKISPSEGLGLARAQIAIVPCRRPSICCNGKTIDAADAPSPGAAPIAGSESLH